MKKLLPSEVFEPLIGSVDKLSDLNNPTLTIEIPVVSGEFKKVAFQRLDVRQAILVLRSPKTSYPGHKEALFSAFCAWCIDPMDPSFVQSAIRLSTLKTVALAEKQAQAEYRFKGVALDSLVRLAFLGKYFIEEIYQPVGGAMGFARGLSIKEFKSELASHRTALSYALKIVQIYHYHVAHLIDEPKYGVPSLNKATKLIGDLEVRFGNHRKPPSESSIKAYWASKKASIAFVYAASTISCGSGTLLDVIFKGENNTESHLHVFDEWMSRSRFVEEAILSQCAETQTYRDAAARNPTKRLLEFSAPQYTDIDAERIAREFKRSA